MRRVSKKILVTLAALFVFAVSCKDSFLEVAPTTTITDSQLMSKAGLEGQLIGVYSMLSGRGSDFYAGTTNWFWGSVMGAEANKGTNSGDQGQMNEVQAYRATPGNNSVLNKYRALYEGIARANAVFRTVADIRADATNTTDVRIVDRVEAEAKFLRALYYFELKRMWNNTPYVDESVDYHNGIDDVGNDKDLYPFIEQDLLDAIGGLPQVMDAAGRANRSAAWAYLGKVYLYEKKYAQARVMFDSVMTRGKTASGVTYALIPNYGDLFRVANDNNSESVFAVQSAAGTGSVGNANPDFVLNYPYNGGPAGCCGFFQPSFDQVNSFRTSGGLPLPGNEHRLAINELKADQDIAASPDWDATETYDKDALVTRMAPGNVSRQYKALSDGRTSDPLTTPADWVMTWEEDTGPVDPRLDFAVGRRGIPYMDHGRHPGVAWIRDQQYGGPYAPKKYIWSIAEDDAKQVDRSSWTPGYDAHNVYLIRYADVLLMAAEVEIEDAGGDLTMAVDLINQVRARARDGAVVMDGAFPAANYDIDLYGALNQAAAREALRKERRLELSGEGHRFFDLIRWGIGESELNPYLDYEQGKVGSGSPFLNENFTAGKSEYLPIPQTEIDILGKDVLTQNPGYN